MPTVITINDYELPIREYNGQRVVTFKDIDSVHGRSEGTARKRFNDNREHFIEGVDYFIVDLTASEIRTQFGAGKNAGRTLTLMTECGYLMLVKSFTDDLAWDVQRTLVNSYFRAKTSGKSYPAKATSAGEVSSLIKNVRIVMERQGSSSERIAQQIELLLCHFGIPVIDSFVKNSPWEQPNFLTMD